MSDLNRRQFLQAGAALGAGAIAAKALAAGQGAATQAPGLWEAEPHGTGADFEDYAAADVIYTTCQQCNTHCPVKAVLTDKGAGAGRRVRKLAGNPYSPLNNYPHGPVGYGTAPGAAVQPAPDMPQTGRSRRGGKTCLKGQAGIQTTYDAYRVTQPMRRVGPRGSGQWQTITWEQAVREIVAGNQDLGTPGLKQIWAYAPKEKVMADWEAVKAGKMTQAGFDQQYKNVLIDTRHPDLGPKSNQIAVMGGHRIPFLNNRVTKQGFGSVNYTNHQGICGGSGVVANNRSFTSTAAKPRLYADMPHCQFLLVWGTNPAVASRGPTWLGPMLSEALARGMKLAVVDPRLSKTAEKAHWWVPIKPGTDAALAFAMARWIIENKRYDERYLRNPGPRAAAAGGEPTWSDATHLVNVDAPGQPKLRMENLAAGAGDKFVALENGKPAAHDAAMDGALEVDTTLNGIRVKSVFTLYKERVMEQTLAQYAAFCGVPEAQITELAREFTAHGKRAAVTLYRGAVKHTHGYYTVRAVNALQHLIGNYDWKGGQISLTLRFPDQTGRYEVLPVPGGHKPWGIPISREGVKYETTTLFARDGYPARRPWMPVGLNVIEEYLPSAAEGYPYPLKALFIDRISVVVSAAGGNLQADLLRNAEVIPLVVAFDVTIGDTSQYADYLLPDLTYLERWGMEAQDPNTLWRFTAVMQPVTRAAAGPRQGEDVWIAILKAMGLPGAGPQAFKDGSSLDRAEDYYLKMVANVAYAGASPVPDASPEEQALFAESRGKALGQAFDLARWQKAVKPEEWPKVVYVLNRGGRFEAPGNEYEGDWTRYRLAGQANFYDEGVAVVKESYSGKFLDGLPRLEVTRLYNGQAVVQSFPLDLINWKARHMGTHRNQSDVWLREIRPANYLWMNPADAAPRGIGHGDMVKLKTGGGEAQVRVMLTQGIRPGVVGADFSFGHTGYGARPVTIDGKVIQPPRPYGHTTYDMAPPLREEAGLALGRDTGFNFNALALPDPSLKHSALIDPIGGSSAQLDTRVEVTKA